MTALRARLPLAVAFSCAGMGVALLSAAPAQALSCAEPSATIAENPHLFVARLVDTRGDEVLLQVEAQRPGQPVPTQVWVKPGGAEWLGWDDLGDADEIRASGMDQTRWLIASDDTWAVGACSAWDVTDEGRGSGVESAFTQVTEAVGTHGAEDTDSPASPSAGSGASVEAASSTDLALAAAGGIALGGAALAAGLARRRP